MKFQPWLDFEQGFDPSVLDIPISEPPCVHCKWWHPRRLIGQDGKMDGVRLCNTPKDQCKDFSCYEAKAGDHAN